MEPITDGLSLRKQNLFFVKMEYENCVSIEFWLTKSCSDLLKGNYKLLKPDYWKVTFVKG